MIFRNSIIFQSAISFAFWQICASGLMAILSPSLYKYFTFEIVFLIIGRLRWKIGDFVLKKRAVKNGPLFQNKVYAIVLSFFAVCCNGKNQDTGGN